MTTNKVTDFFVPELLAEAVQAQFVGLKALWGTEAATINFAMPAGKAQVGTSIKIPYFTSLGEFQDLVNDGDALTTATQTSAPQVATVLHSGKAFELTHWAQLAALGDPYQLAAKQIAEGFMRRGDLALINAAVDTSNAYPLVNDVSGTGAGTITYDSVVDSKMLWSDELSDIALMVVHPKVFGDMLKLKDSAGRPLLTDINEGGVSKFVGIPVGVSARIPLAGGIYSNVLCKKGSLILWVNGSPSIIEQPDVLIDARITACHMYYACHRYNPYPGGTKPGVVVYKTK